MIERSKRLERANAKWMKALLHKDYTDEPRCVSKERYRAAWSAYLWADAWRSYVHHLEAEMGLEYEVSIMHAIDPEGVYRVSPSRKSDERP